MAASGKLVLKIGGRWCEIDGKTDSQNWQGVGGGRAPKKV